ncbi:MAG: 4Fe-4S binding protein [Prevotella sp.]|nr:4Fe-4S binding protein [Prevotella sp.]
MIDFHSALFDGTKCDEVRSEGDVYTINADECVDCGSCASVCPQEAIQPE